jgi:hypothetical protein
MTERKGTGATRAPRSWVWLEDGCDLWRHCLTCPLPACRFELPPKRAEALMRAGRLGLALAEGRTIAVAASLVGVSRREAFRLLDLPGGGGVAARMAAAAAGGDR